MLSWPTKVMMSNKEAAAEISHYLEIRELGRGRSNEQGQRQDLDDVSEQGIAVDEDVVLFAETETPIRAHLTESDKEPIVILNAQEKPVVVLPRVIFLKNGLMIKNAVDLKVGESSVVRPFTRGSRGRLPIPRMSASRITHRRGPFKTQKLTSESHAQPVPQGSPRRSGAEYPER